MVETASEHEQRTGHATADVIRPHGWMCRDKDCPACAFDQQHAKPA